MSRLKEVHADVEKLIPRYVKLVKGIEGICLQKKKEEEEAKKAEEEKHDKKKDEKKKPEEEEMKKKAEEEKQIKIKAMATKIDEAATEYDDVREAYLRFFPPKKSHKKQRIA